MSNKKFDFDDILTPPALFTHIESRKDIDIYDKDGNLPLFTAPMDTVINLKNTRIFEENKIIPISPRTENNLHGNEWIAISLKEFEKLVESKNMTNSRLHVSFKQYMETFPDYKLKILVDVANGHMRKLYDLAKKSKEKYPDITLMIGNVANPGTYAEYSKIGVDYVRVGIGNGGGCLTTEQTGIGYPMASLIAECRYIKDDLFHNKKKTAKIVADGGFKKYADIIKALGLGADYVMLGSIFNKALESCADTYRQNKKHDGWTEPGEKVDQFSKETLIAFNNGTQFFKKYRGMSTKGAQKALGNEVLKTSEGITRMNPVEYTLSGWVENFAHYLSSHMSYVNAKKLDHFIGTNNYVKITQNAFKRYNK